MVYDRDPTLRSSPLPSSAAPDSGEVALKGTDGSSASSPEFRFKTSADSNVVVKINGRASPPEIEIGVYYV